MTTCNGRSVSDRRDAWRKIRALCGTAVVALGIALAAGPAAQAQDRPPPERPSGWTDKAPVTAERFMVVSANGLATDAGAAVLERGGSAADALVAVQLMLNLVEPQSSGIGGGAFLLYWDAKAGKLTTFDGRETAPRAAGPDLFLKPDGTPMGFMEAVVGGRSVGVPGTLALLELAHRLHGRLPWAELLQPTIDLAERGFPISPRLAGAIAGPDGQGLDRFETTKAYFLEPDGKPKAAGTVLKNPDFAATLRKIAAEGSASFYRGDIGAAIVRTVRESPANPAQMTMEDLAGYRVILREPVCRPYREVEVCGMGPPSSGGLTVLQMLGILEHVNMAGQGPTVDGVHAFLEAAKLAYADRDLYIADPDFVSVPTWGLLDPLYLTTRAQQLRLDSAMEKATAGNPLWRRAAEWAPDMSHERPGTSHFVIVDADGNAVSMTTTIESGFGSRLMAGGFLLNNELTDFSFQPQESGRPIANRVEGGKRPRSSMAPTIVFDRTGDPMLLVGSPGGSRIIPYVAQVIVGVVDWGMTPQEAINQGHIVNRNGPTELEAATPIAALEQPLTARGHKVQLRDQNSGLHAIMIEPGRLTSGVDPRREGAAKGR